MKQLKIWIEAIRLRTLPVSLSGVLIAVGLAKADGRFRLLPALACVVFALLAQIVSNLANEYFDFKAGTDKKGRVGPRRGVTEGDIKPDTMKWAMIGTLVVACLVGLSMLVFVDAGENYQNWLMLIGAGILIAIFAFAYSAGPYPLSYHCLGEVTVMLFYGIVPVIFTYYVVTQQFTAFAVLASLAIGFMGVNVLLVNNYRDVDDDREAGKRTSVVVFGRKLAAFAYLLNGFLAISVMGAFWLSMYFGGKGWWIFIAPAVYLVLHIVTWNKLRLRDGAALNPLLGATARNMLIFTLLLLAALLFA